MYLKHKKNGQFFVYTEALFNTGNFEKFAELPKKEVEAEVPALAAEDKPAPKQPRAKK